MIHFLLVACRVVGTKPLRWELSSSRPSRAPEPRIEPLRLWIVPPCYTKAASVGEFFFLFLSSFLLSLPPAFDLGERSEDVTHACSKIIDPVNLDLASSPLLDSRLAEAGGRVTHIITYISLPASLAA